MKVNRTLTIGILKNDLIYILLETDAQKHDKLFQQIYEDILYDKYSRIASNIRLGFQNNTGYLYPMEGCKGIRYCLFA